MGIQLGIFGHPERPPVRARSVSTSLFPLSLWERAG
jgi:hypothetical protein